MLIDAHTHLNEERLFKNWKLHVKSFYDIGGKILINSWANPLYNLNWIHIAQENHSFLSEVNIKTTIGIHPCDTKKEYKSQIDEIEDLYLKNRKDIVAIGECWIDLHFSDSPHLSLQQEAFQAQAELARKYELPLVIHSRDAFEETFEILKNFADLKLYIHSRAYDENALKKCEATFPRLRIGINNIFTYPSAKIIREAILKKTSAKLLIETDAPYLPPQTKRWEINYPHYCINVYDFYANLTWREKKDLENEIENNVKELFKL